MSPIGSPPGNLYSLYAETLSPPPLASENLTGSSSSSGLNNAQNLDCLDLLMNSDPTLFPEILTPPASKPRSPSDLFRPISDKDNTQPPAAAPSGAVPGALVLFHPIPVIAQPACDDKKNLFKQIENRLHSIRNAISTGKATEITIASIEELANQIRKLRANVTTREKAKEFFKILEELADVISIAHVAADPVIKRPLIGPTTKLQELAETYSAGNIKNGLNKLDKIFLMRSIRGDGHCLFRSTMTYILENLLMQKEEVRLLAITKLDQKVANFNKPSLHEKYQFFKTTLQHAIAKKRPFDAIISDEETSDKLVAFLRELVCEHNRQNENDVFNSFMNVSGKSKDEYLADMMSMGKATSGDHPEVLALSTLLGINICVVDIAEYGKTTDPLKQGQAFRHLKAHEGAIDLFLIHRPGHYDLGLLRNKVERDQQAADKVTLKTPSKPTRSNSSSELAWAQRTRAIIEYALAMGHIVRAEK